MYRIRLGDGAFGVAAIVSETTDQWRSERRVRRVIDALGGFVGLLAPDGAVLEANGEALGASGLTAADVVGQPLWDTLWWKHDPEHRDRLMAGVREAAAGRPVRFDAVVQVGDRFVTLDLHLAPLEENGAVVAVVASGEDISQRRSATRRLRSLGEYWQALAVAETSAEVAEAVLRHVPQAIDADFVTLALRDDRDETLVFIHPPSLSPELAARYTRLPLDTPAPLTDAVRNGEMVIVRDNEENRLRYPELIDDAVEAGLASVAAAPLVIEDEVVGAIGFGWARPLPRRGLHGVPAGGGVRADGADPPAHPHRRRAGPPDRRTPPAPRPDPAGPADARDRRPLPGGRTEHRVRR